ncbi:MAG: HlyD family efflux transporter periplasmic adaptor subunit [Leptolyngbyaceae cyanobacterium CSU_1_3]|nr:HlyD family efflux transporter periplasmic adaptor subunit [Leptolyngbyaceae cyanobacterium CSU_1_3]
MGDRPSIVSPLSLPLLLGSLSLTPTGLPPLTNVLDQPPSALPLHLAIAGIAFSIGFAAWAYLGQVNEVARAQGRLIPQGEVYKVNPIELGKVSRLIMKEGKFVKAGQVLVELDDDLATHEIERLEQDLAAAQTELSQAQTLLSQTHLQAQTHFLVTRSATQAQEVEVAQAKSNINTTQELLSQLQTDAFAQSMRLAKFQPLVAEGAIAQEQVFQLEQSLRDRQRTITEHRGALNRSLTEIERLQTGVTQKQAEEKEVQQKAEQNAQELAMRITQIRAKISNLETMRVAANSKLKQRYVYAPTSGVVSALHVRNVGEVVQPGQPIADIAPSHKPLVLSAILPNQEAGFVKVGMPVQIKFDAYPYQDYGMVSGSVVSISPDARSDDRLGQVYRLDVQLDRTYIIKDQQKVSLKSGQTASAEIITRRRRIIDVMLDPLKKLQTGINL